MRRAYFTFLFNIIWNIQTSKDLVNIIHWENTGKSCIESSEEKKEKNYLVTNGRILNSENHVFQSQLYSYKSCNIKVGVFCK